MKVLRSHIEELPLPMLSVEERVILGEAVASAERTGDLSAVNDAVYGMFGLSGRDISYIRNSIL